MESFDLQTPYSSACMLQAFTRVAHANISEALLEGRWRRGIPRSPMEDSVPCRRPFKHQHVALLNMKEEVKPSVGHIRCLTLLLLVIGQVHKPL